MTFVSDPTYTELFQLLPELSTDVPPPSERPVDTGTDTDAIPPIITYTAAYHTAFNLLPPDDREKQSEYYQRIFDMEEAATDSLDFNIMMLEDDVVLDLTRVMVIEAAVKTLERAAELHSPTIDFQQKHAIDTYSKVKTASELVFEATFMAECSGQSTNGIQC